MRELEGDYWQNELIKALVKENITDDNFFNFLKRKIKSYPLKVEDFGWGVFPIINDKGILTDIRIIVPIIYDIKSLCVNIHEYVHAYETYLCLGKVYVWHIEESEQKARDAEKRYLKSLNKN